MCLPELQLFRESREKELVRAFSVKFIVLVTSIARVYLSFWCLLWVSRASFGFEKDLYYTGISDKKLLVTLYMSIIL